MKAMLQKLPTPQNNERKFTFSSMEEPSDEEIEEILSEMKEVLKNEREEINQIYHKLLHEKQA